MPFADNCPNESCPPDDVEPVNGVIVRFVKNDPPTHEDFMTWADKGLEAEDPCDGCSVSVLRSLKDVAEAIKASPWFRKRKVAVAELSHEHGVIKQTGPSKHHHSLWVERSHIASLHSRFRVK